jgi:hypothetical protein
MEYMREQKFSVYIDTNKRTIKKDFEALPDLIAFVEELAASDEASTSSAQRWNRSAQQSSPPLPRSWLWSPHQ